MIKANNPKLKSWLATSKDSDFPIQNIPFGIIKPSGLNSRVGTRIGDHIIDLSALAEFGYFDNLGLGFKDMLAFRQCKLNDFIELGKPAVRNIRSRISEIFESNSNILKNNEKHKTTVLYQLNDVELLLPVNIGDYTDFYSSKEHATNVGIMFRDPANALLPNWSHMPVAYHGRSSSIVVSNTNIHRPKGQLKGENTNPHFGPTQQMDFELEMAFVVGKDSELGDSVSSHDAENYIFGMFIFNDLSARDIQKWEYVPLGPFLGKNFGSVVSPWIVTMDALEPFRTKGPEQDKPILPYLSFEGEKSFDINLDVFIQPDGKKAHRVCQSNFKYLYWNMSQQLAHHTANGCNIQIGDVCASGTISGPTKDSFGSMLELSWKGQNPIIFPDGSERKFIADNDQIIMQAYAQNEDVRIGFGESITKILPTK
ncbi:MAG: fumarylacetoacetase [Bacteroidetes bacterium]|nr:fumarylacetoacetase [Bacteroidota bacterium]